MSRVTRDLSGRAKIPDSFDSNGGVSLGLGDDVNLGLSQTFPEPGAMLDLGPTEQAKTGLRLLSPLGSELLLLPEL